MNQATEDMPPWLDQIAKTPFPSYHAPLTFARTLARSDHEPDREKAILLLHWLVDRYPLVLAIGQELVFVLMESKQPEEAERKLKRFEIEFRNLDEEFLCRWGRLYKDRGDEYAALPWTSGERDSPALAETYYAKSLEKYDKAYRVREGFYPGINKATVLLILGSMKPLSLDGSLVDEVREATDLAGTLIDRRPNWRQDLPDDEDVWVPATLGEAHLIRREWADAAEFYRQAGRSKKLTAHSRKSMNQQIQRILICFRKLGFLIPPPFDELPTLFGEGTEL